ncbi:hypothetical protein FQZ97_1136240 [compost metagenome]
MLTVTLPTCGNSCVSTLARKRSMMRCALSCEVERSSTTNSSPPKRNTRSWARKEEVSRLAIRISTSSPYRWPNLSLTCLKWSTSTTASHCFSWSLCWRRSCSPGGSASASCSAVLACSILASWSSKVLRLSRPVSESRSL